MVEAEGAVMLAAGQAEAVVATAAPEPGVPANLDLDCAYLWAKRGYALVPAIAGTLVAIPVAVISWSTFVRHQPMLSNHAWFLLFLIPAALLILAGWVRFEKPSGIPVGTADAPELFALIEKLRSYLKAPRIDAVYLTDTFAAQAIQRPSRGLFGGTRNEIIIGLPLLQSVSKAEAAVLIAHELGHLSGRSGEKAAVVHQARNTWQHILDRQSQQPLYLRFPFALLARWFGPKFLALSAAQERAAEFAADGFAAQIAGPDAVGTALQRLSIAEEFLAEYWRRFAEEPVTTPEPVLSPHREMANFLPRMTEWELAEDILQVALTRAPADPAHPVLAERLAALGVEPSIPGPVAQSSAGLLGPFLDTVMTRFDDAWRAQATPAWRKAFESLPPSARRLLDLDALAKHQALDLASAFERARLAYYAGGLVEAQGRYEEALAWHTEDGRAWLAAGIAMVDGGSPEGPACLREALKMAPSTDWAKGHAEEWFAVGEALLGSSDDLGIDCLEQAIRIDPIRTDMASFLVDRYLDQSASATAAA